MKSFKFTKEGVRAGKITVAAGLFGVLVVGGIAMLGGYSARVGASGGNGSASTAVKVLNTPPRFDNGTVGQVGYPFEVITSATTTPWLNGNPYAWSAHANDTSGDHIYLLVCSSSTTPPTAHDGAAPTCGTTLVAISAAFFNAANATTSVNVFATTTVSTSNETIPWVAYVCDDATNSKCSAADPGQPGQNNASPAAVTHPFYFSGLASVVPAKDPGSAFTITASSSQTTPADVNNGTVTAKLYVCKNSGFDIPSRSCTGVGGAYSSSTAGAAVNPTANYAFPIPTIANNYTGYTYVIDQYGYQAVGVQQGSSTPFTVNNVAPSTYNVSIASSTLLVTNPGGLTTSSGFTVNFSADDNNGCLNKNAQNEFSTTTLQFYRNGATCTTVGNHDDHSCYTNASTTALWTASTTCSQSSCGAITAQWACTFPLSYMTDPTGAGTPWNGQGWRARVTMTDSGGLVSAATTSITDSQVSPFNFVDLSQSGIDFGAFQPGSGNTNLGDNGASSTLGFITKGNTSVDTGVRISDMCPGYSSSTLCTGNETTDTIFSNRQHYGTSSLAYAAGAQGTSTVDTAFALRVPKNTILGSFNSKNTLWGILVPGSLTISGDYKGLDTFVISSNSDTSSW